MTASGKGRRRKRKIALQQVTIRGLGQAVSLWIYLENAHNRLVGTDPLCYERQGRALRGYIPPGAEFSKAVRSANSPVYTTTAKRGRRESFMSTRIPGHFHRSRNPIGSRPPW